MNYNSAILLLRFAISSIKKNFKILLIQLLRQKQTDFTSKLLFIIFISSVIINKLSLTIAKMPVFHSTKDCVVGLEGRKNNS